MQDSTILTVLTVLSHVLRTIFAAIHRPTVADTAAAAKNEGTLAVSAPALSPNIKYLTVIWPLCHIYLYISMTQVSNYVFESLGVEIVEYTSVVLTYVYFCLFFSKSLFSF